MTSLNAQTLRTSRSPHERVLDRSRLLTLETPLVVRSPGRVNLIGEHTDYNLGFVLPSAIDRAVTFALAPRTDGRCIFYAVDIDDEAECDLTNLRHDARGWPNYVYGVIDQVLKAGHAFKGVTCVYGGDIPIGAGLSSSAAIEAGFAFALNELFALGIDRLGLVKLAQSAENEFVGVQCGIMDQYINIFGEEHAVLRIDCASLENQKVQVNGDVAILLANTEVSHSLAGSEYNTRRRECAEGVSVIARRHTNVASLRDVTPEMLEEAREDMPAIVSKRCGYIIKENDRLLRGCVDLERGDLNAFGAKMYEAHEGLSREYEVSCPELDELVRIVHGQDGVYGARMMGGGFGGCTINLVHPDAVGQVRDRIEREFQRVYGRKPPTYVTTMAAGTHIVSGGGR